MNFYKLRLYPTDFQQRKLDIIFVICNLLYNGLLDQAEVYFNTLEELPTEEWFYSTLDSLLEDKNNDYCLVNKVCLKRQAKSVYSNLRLNNFNFTSMKHKTNYGKQSYLLSNRIGECEISIDFRTEKIVLPDVENTIKYRDNRVFNPSDVKSVCIIKETTDKHYITFEYMPRIVIEPTRFNNANVDVGIDMGIKDFCTVVNQVEQYRKYKNYNLYEKELNRISKLEQISGNKIYGSIRKKKVVAKLNKIHEKVANKRSDWHHKLSSEFTNKARIICVETLDIRRMIEHFTTPLRIYDVAWGNFMKMLKYKQEYKGHKYVQVGRYFPSTQRHKDCGYINRELKDTRHREWVCNGCGVKFDRDLNAAKNILQEGLLLLSRR